MPSEAGAVDGAVGKGRAHAWHTFARSPTSSTDVLQNVSDEGTGTEISLLLTQLGKV